jgi:hypothetical protein
MIAKLTPDEARARLANALAHVQDAMALADDLARTPHHYLGMAARALEALVSDQPRSMSESKVAATTMRGRL